MQKYRLVVGYFGTYKMISDIILTLNTKHTCMDVDI